MPKIKICGISRIEDIESINTLLPDYIGFVFACSKRQVSEPVAIELKRKLDPEIKSVGVFVDDDIMRIVHLCNTEIIDGIQLHGEEGEDYIRELKSQVSIPVIKAVRVRNQWDIMQAEKLSCDYLLLDAFKEGQCGGSGETFDWSLVPEITKPFFLAGGLHSDNVIQAIRHTKPYAIDVSSGVETNGYKDRVKIKAFITQVRGA